VECDGEDEGPWLDECPQEEQNFTAGPNVAPHISQNLEEEEEGELVDPLGERICEEGAGELKEEEE